MKPSWRASAPFAVLFWLAACGDGGTTTPDACAAAGACVSPPADRCASATTALAYPATGRCAVVGGAAVCDYPPALLDCAAAGRVCDAGACVAVPPDPCAAPGVCSSPPADGCTAAGEALHYPATGACASAGGVAQCSYPPAPEDCAAAGKVCSAGACVAPDPCADASACTSPPPATCASATVRLAYPSTGVCTSNGGAASCDYPATEVDCALAGQVCDAGACVDPPPDPCAAPGVCTTPPLPSCETVGTALTYAAPGACTAAGQQASCSYPPTVVDCTLTHQLCANGACVADPCFIPPDGAGFLAYAAWEVATLSYDLRAVRLDGTCDQPLAEAAGDDLEPSWRVVGGQSRLAWGGARGGHGRLVVMDLADGLQRVLDTGADLATSPALSADGATLLFELRPFSASTSDLRQVPAAGGAPASFFGANSAAWTEVGWTEAGPAWSADGSRLYFVSEDRSSGWPEIWRGAAGGRPQQVTFGSSGLGTVILGKPALSADGRWLAYARESKTAGSASKVMVREYNAATQVWGAERLLTDEGDSEPAFPALGVQVAGKDVVAVRTDRYGLYDLVLLDVATGAVLQRLTDGARLVGTPAFPR